MARTAQQPLNTQEQKDITSEQVVQEPNSPRRKRGVFNGTQLKLTVNQTIPGYVLHVFTDHNMRIQEAEANGWQFVSPDEVGGTGNNVVSHNGDLGSRVRYLVNPRTEQGEAKYGYLMKMRKDWWEEDQQELAKKADVSDDVIRKGKARLDNPAFYTPKGANNSVKNNQQTF